jgi:uncharacterized protein (TIGR02452 family)
MLNKNERAKLAKQTINKTIPDILKHNVRASNGVKNTELIRFAPHHDAPRKPSVPESSDSTTSSTNPSNNTATQSPQPAPVSVSVIKSDTLDAAYAVQCIIPPHLLGKTNTCVLNMASALHPGGGVVNGALAQEESLCMRSTLYASLNPSWYRLPDLSCIYTPDVLVFRDTELQALKINDQFFCSVISVAALKNPDLSKTFNTKKGIEERAYANEQDKEIMMAKIRGLFDVVKAKGVTHLVLGALGCGAYHNPPMEVAKMFKRVIEGDRRHKGVEGLDIVFAIFDEGENLRTFREVFPGQVSGVVGGGS